MDEFKDLEQTSEETLEEEPKQEKINDIPDAPKELDESVTVEELLNETEQNSEEYSEEQEASSESVDTEEEAELEKASYQIECRRCSTVIYFNEEDIDESGNIVCPRCEEEIEINKDNLNAYRAKKYPESIGDTDEFVVDCESCENVINFKKFDITEENLVYCSECGKAVEIDTEVLDAYKVFDEAAAIKKRKIRKTVIASVCGCLAGILVALAVIWFVGNNDVLKITVTDSKTKQVTLTEKVPMYVYKVLYANAKQQAAQEGMNLQNDPKKQPYTADDELEESEDQPKFDTWAQKLEYSTVELVKEYVSIHAMAKDCGYEAPEGADKEAEKIITQFDEEAEKSNLSFADYMKKITGVKISRNDFIKYINYETYCRFFVTEGYAEILAKDIADKDAEAKYKESPDDYTTAHILYYYRKADDSFTKAEMNKAIKEFNACKTADEFKKVANKYITADTSLDGSGNGYIESEAIAKSQFASSPFTKEVNAFGSDENTKKNSVMADYNKEADACEALFVVSPMQKDLDLVKKNMVSEDVQSKLQKVVGEATADNEIGYLLTKLFY